MEPYRFPSRIGNIDVIIEVIYFHEGHNGYGCGDVESYQDMVAPEDDSIGYNILDVDGNPAPHLEDFVSDDDYERFIDEYLTHKFEDDNDY